jgi:L-alanine-DL-glutamate epimerase-like enolase superfamily enzyme
MKRRVTAHISPIAAVLSDVVGGHGHKTQTRRGLELTLSVDESLQGLGEASPILGFSLDRLEDVLEALEALETFELPFPKTPEDCRGIIAEQSERLPNSQPSARFAFEGALLDLFARYFGLSAASLIRTWSNWPHPINEQIALTRLITSTDSAVCLTKARQAWQRGYRVFKLKLEPGNSFDETLANLRAIRDKFGKELVLRLDPNGSFPAEDLERLLVALAPFEPEFVEEPAFWTTLRTLRQSPVPLAIDESLVDPEALSTLLLRREALRLKAAIVKPALHGLLRAIELAEEAHRSGLDVIVTHLFDGPVGHATALSLAQAVGSPHRAQGLAPQPGLLMVPNRRIAGLGHGQAWHENQPGLPLLEVKTCSA